MTDEQLANRLLCALSADELDKAELFDYLCWKEERDQKERVPGAPFLCLASDGMTCWGKAFRQAVRNAMKHDAGLRDCEPPWK